METLAISRRNITKKKANKENAQPPLERKPDIKRDKPSVALMQLKGNEKEETLTRNYPLKSKAKQVHTNLSYGEPVQNSGKGSAASDFKQKVATEAMKPPAALTSSRSAPGMYKGKIVQSKIGSIWKSAIKVGSEDSKTESQMVGNVTQSRSKSVTNLPGTVKHESTRSNRSMVSKSTHLSKPTVTSRPPTGFCSSRSLGKTLPLTSGTQNLKAKITMTEVNKPPVSSSLSQYKFTMETAEERRAKLAEWLSSKGKTLKRPAMTKAAPTKKKISGKSQPVAQCKPKPEHSLILPRPDCAAAAAHCTYAQAVLTHSQTPVDTTLELLENSDAALLNNTQDKVDNIVMNLCHALEAMATPSECNDEHAQVSDDCDVEIEKGENKIEKVQNEILKDLNEPPKFETVKNQPEESYAEEAENESDTTPQMKDASVIKYSVRTTPYLQSVRKTLEGEASTSNSRRKSNIKDLKFLTPVRRSCRIQHKSSHLPTMLHDHDPSVSSLAELVKLDDNANAYIYRKNPALLGDLPDQPDL